MLKTRDKKVVVLLAAYNGTRWIQEQLNSILNQQDVNVSVFISVDLSDDGTYEWAQAIAEKEERVFVLPYGECFGGAGANFFRLIKDVDFSKFDAVAFADQDDIWESNKLATAYKKLEAGCDAYSSNVMAFWQDGREALINKSQQQRKLDYFFEAAGPGCTYVFKTEAMLAFKQFLIEAGSSLSEVSLHDWLAYAYFRENGYKWFIDEWPSMRYRQHANNQVGTNNNIKAYKKRFDLIRGKWLRNQVNAIARLIAPKKTLKLSNRWFLIRNFTQLRRRARDRYFLLLIILLGLY